MTLYRFFKLTEGNSKLNPASVRDDDNAVELDVNAKPLPKCRGECPEFTPEQQATCNIACYACMHSSPTEASHTLISGPHKVTSLIYSRNQDN